MKKKILALMFAVLLAIMVPISAFATGSFNKAVFDNADDLTVKADDMSGITNIYSTSLSNGKAAIYVDWYTTITVMPTISLSDEVDGYLLGLYYVGQNWAFINNIIVKIGDHRYTISDFDVSRKVRSGSSVQEYICLFANSETIPMIQDLIEHRDEEIKVRFSGSNKNIDFTLTDDIKNGMINLYNLYVAGGGTNEKNIDLITKLDKTTVTVATVNS